MNLNQVSLPSSDVDRSAAFYRLLGFTQIVRSLPRYARFECPVGGATFSLHLIATVPKDSGVIVYFECDDVDDVCRRLEASGVKFDSPPKDQSWLWREAYLREPDGNLICLYHAGEVGAIRHGACGSCRDFYGTTADAGRLGEGTVFEISSA